MQGTATARRKKNELYFPQAEAFFQEWGGGEKEFPAPGLVQVSLHWGAFCPVRHVQPPTYITVTIPGRPQDTGSLHRSLSLRCFSTPIRLSTPATTLAWATPVSLVWPSAVSSTQDPIFPPLTILSPHSSHTVLLKCQGLVTPSPEAGSLRIKSGDSHEAQCGLAPALPVPQLQEEEHLSVPTRQYPAISHTWACAHAVLFAWNITPS